ncbi:MAG: hypothetical protein ABL903_12780 [Methylococcales bacterium]
MNNCCCVSKDTLTPEAQSNIEDLIGDKLAFVIAVSKNGRTLIAPEGININLRNVSEISEKNPIKTTAITSFGSSAFISYIGSCHIIWQEGDKFYEIDLPDEYCR